MADGRNKAYSKVAAAGIIFAKSAPWVNVPQKFLTAVFCFRLPEDWDLGLGALPKRQEARKEALCGLAVAAENFVPASCSRTRSGWRRKVRLWSIIQSFQFLSITRFPRLLDLCIIFGGAILIVCRGSGEENEREGGASYGCMARVSGR